MRPTSVLYLLTAALSLADAIFRPGTLPLDSDGNQVHAHGGGLLTVNNTFYWYGTSQKKQLGWISEGVNLYSSTDLEEWKFEAEILHANSITDMPLPPPYRIERPSILFNEISSKYVMLLHTDTPAFQYPAVGIAESTLLQGPYSWVRTFKPDGRDSFDMSAYTDAAGGYLIRSVDNQFLGISPLGDDFHDTKGICSAAARAEAPAVFQPDDHSIFIIGSHLTGWDANPAILFEADAPSLCEAHIWHESAPARGPGSGTTFESQAAAVFKYTYKDGSNLFIYMGDRWNAYGPGSVGQASYVWLPLLPTPDSSFELPYFDHWTPESVKPWIDAHRTWGWGATASACWHRGWRGCSRAASSHYWYFVSQLHLLYRAALLAAGAILT